MHLCWYIDEKKYVIWLYNHPDKVWVQYCSNFDYWAPRRDSEFDIGNSLDFKLFKPLLLNSLCDHWRGLKISIRISSVYNVQLKNILSNAMQFIKPWSSCFGTEQRFGEFGLTKNAINFCEYNFNVSFFSSISTFCQV